MTGIILAGGLSRRLGQDKAFVNIGGQTVIQRAITGLSKVCQDVMIVANSPEGFLDLGVRVEKDMLDKVSALVGIYSGLVKSASEYNFVCACDMPFINAKIIKYLVDRTSGFDLVIPVTPDGLEPLHAVYAKSCLDPIRESIEREDFKIISFFEKVKVNYIDVAEIRHLDPQRLSFFNVNTPQDLQKAEQLSS